MKKLDQVLLQKRLFVSIKRHLRLTNKHLDHPEGQVEVEFPLMGSYFLISFIYIKKNSFFFKKGTFNEASDPPTLYLFKIVPEDDHFMKTTFSSCICGLL